VNTRVRALLAYVAWVVMVLSFVNFGWSWLHHASPVPILVSHPLLLLSIGYLLFGFYLPATFGGAGLNRVLPPPGPVVAAGRCGGRIGRLAVSGRLITVTAYADRLTLRLILISGEYTIHGSEIRSVAENGPWRRQVVIEHTAPGRASPLLLHAPPDDLRWAIFQIRRDPVDLPGAGGTDRAIRHATTFLYGAGVLLAVGLVVFGVVQVVGSSNLFFVPFVAFGLGGVYWSAREFVNYRRQN